MRKSTASLGVYLFTLLVWFPAFAGDSVQKFSLNTSFGAVSGEELMKAIYPAFQLKSQRTGRKFSTVDAQMPKELGEEAVAEISAKEFPFAKGTLGVLMTTRLDHVPKDQNSLVERHLTLFVIGNVNHKWTTSVESALHHSGPEEYLWSECPEDNCQTKFDFANYRMSDTERAFGVRLTTSTAGSGGGEDREELMLFQRTPTKLTKVLHENVTLYEYSHGPANGSGEVNGHEENHKVLLSVDKNKTNGYYDWLLTSQDKNVKNKKPTRRLFQWDGTKYKEIKR